MEDSNKKSPSEIRRQKKKRRNTIKFLGFIFMVTLVLGLYISKDRWMPNFKVDSSGFTDDEISAAGFPLKVSNGTNYRTCGLGDRLVVLTDTRMYIYTASGEVSEIRSHTYSNPILRSSGNRTLIYEQNGVGMRVDSVRGMLYEKKMDSTIYLASVSSKGYSAVVTESDQYVCELRVYDGMGDEIYFRGCTERITDVVFKNDGRGCFIVSLNVSEGHIISEISSIDFGSTDTLWKVSDIQTCPVAAYRSAADEIILCGDTMCTVYSDSGEKITEYQYPGVLTDTSYSESGLAMIFESKERKNAMLSVISDPASGTVTESRISSSFSQVLAWNDRIYLLSDTSVETYLYDGKADRAIELAEPFRDFRKAGRYLFLEGHKKIEKIEF